MSDIHKSDNLQDENVFNKTNCVICLETFTATDKLVTVGKKGIASLIHFSGVHGDERLEDYLSDVARFDPVLVHVKCRKIYTDPRNSRSMTPKDVPSPCKK